MARVPGSLAVATLFTCAVFATATGIVGAVVTLMGLLALPQMLRGGYDVRVSAGAITAGGCLGILIPPSVMLIVYGATAGVSVVQLYAGAFFPGIMLAGLYVVYVILLAKLKPRPDAAAVGRRPLRAAAADDRPSPTPVEHRPAGAAAGAEGGRNLDVPPATSCAAGHGAAAGAVFLAAVAELARQHRAARRRWRGRHGAPRQRHGRRRRRPQAAAGQHGRRAAERRPEAEPPVRRWLAEPPPPPTAARNRPAPSATGLKEPPGADAG
jgi:hypothetical protein